MKKILCLLLVVILSLGVFACGGNDNSNTSKTSATSEEEKIEYVENISNIMSDPDSYKGKWVKFNARIFSKESDENGIYLQAYTDIENYDDFILVYYPDNTMDINEDDFISVDGKIRGKFTGENAFGGEVSMPAVIASTLEKSDYISVVVPTISEITPENAIAEQHDISLKVDKIEFAETETRIYFSMINDSSDPFSLNVYDLRLLQDGKQYEQNNDSMTIYEAGIEEFQGNVLPGITSSGCVTFPAIDSSSPFQIYAEGFSDDYELEFEPFKIDITP